MIDFISLGATYLGGGRCRFRVWAPKAPQVAVHLVSPQERLLPLIGQAHGYFAAVLDGVEPGARYFYRLHDLDRPDPASRCQPQGVHGPSEVIEPHFPWEDRDWRGPALEDYLIYELHVGTFTPAGTFAAIIPHLPELAQLGVTALELMPVAQFPGNRNWGYDGVFPYAVQNSYGGPEGLKKLINACHCQGLAVVLDVVYNHLGPEGNYLRDFGDYFTNRYRTPWGEAVNFDGPESDEVRRFFIENALYWITEYRVDALRLDALHAIMDQSAQPFLAELAASVQAQAARLNRRAYLIAESDLNDARFIRPPELGGLGLDAHWHDDFHHALHALLTGERSGYYQDFGEVRHLAKACREGFVYAGDYSAYRRRRHGSSSRDLPAGRLVVFGQNHDQVGNRRQGERLSALVPFEELKVAAALVLLAPFVPLLFMGEEYGETAPFLYFISHQDPDLIEAVRQGRRQEFAAFHEDGLTPDPQDELTFQRSILNHHLRQQDRHQALYGLYQELIGLRQQQPALRQLSKENLEVREFEAEKVLFLRRWHEGEEVIMIVHFGGAAATLKLPWPAGTWVKRLDTQEKRWYGAGSTLPDAIRSTGEVSLTLPAQALLLLFAKKGDDGALHLHSRPFLSTTER